MCYFLSCVLTTHIPKKIFVMKKFYTLAVMLLFSFVTPAQCPKLVSAMIDACNGSSYEGDNEFMMLTNGSSNILPSQLKIYYASTYPPSASATKNSFTGLSGDYSAAINSYIASLNQEAASAGCPNLFATSVPASGIPENATFIILSPFVTQVYNLNAYCDKKPIYVLVDTAYGSSTCGGASGTNGVGYNRCGTFKNDGASSANNRRYFSVSTTTGCSEDSVSYDYTQLGPTSSAVDGGFVSWTNGSASYSNGGCGQIILPVKLTVFNAAYTDDKHIKIKWESTEEINLKNFIIEVSSDARFFLQLAEIFPKYTNSQSNFYDYVYIPNGNGAFYYRLKMVDLNGNISYSQIVKADNANKTSNGILIYPLPATNLLTISWISNKAGYTYITIVDNSGKILSKERVFCNIGYNAKQSEISKLQPGQYYLHIYSDTEIARSKFLKIK